MGQFYLKKRDMKSSASKLALLPRLSPQNKNLPFNLCASFALAAGMLTMTAKSLPLAMNHLFGAYDPSIGFGAFLLSNVTLVGAGYVGYRALQQSLCHLLEDMGRPPIPKMENVGSTACLFVFAGDQLNMGLLNIGMGMKLGDTAIEALNTNKAAMFLTVACTVFGVGLMQGVLKRNRLSPPQRPDNSTTTTNPGGPTEG